MKKFDIKHYMHIYFLSISQEFKSKMQFRADFFLSMLGILVHNIAGFVTFWVLFRSIKNINGWNYEEIIFLYAFSLLAVTPTQVFLENLWRIQGNVYRGNFIIYYFRPINIFFYYISEVIDVKGISQLFFGSGLLIFAWFKLGIPITFFNILLLLLTLAGASLVMTSILILASASAFWLTNPMSVMLFMSRFRDYARYPITIFNRVFKFVFSFIIPIGFIAFYPSQILIRPNEIGVMSIISPFIGLLFFFISYKVWMKGTRIYSGTGS